jgi:hypothetical protein
MFCHVITLKNSKLLSLNHVGMVHGMDMGMNIQLTGAIVDGRNGMAVADNSVKR